MDADRPVASRFGFSGHVPASGSRRSAVRGSASARSAGSRTRARSGRREHRDPTSACTSREPARVWWISSSGEREHEECRPPRGSRAFVEHGHGVIFDRRHQNEPSPSRGSPGCRAVRGARRAPPRDRREGGGQSAGSLAPAERNAIRNRARFRSGGRTCERFPCGSTGLAGLPLRTARLSPRPGRVCLSPQQRSSADLAPSRRRRLVKVRTSRRCCSAHFSLHRPSRLRAGPRRRPRLPPLIVVPIVCARDHPPRRRRRGRLVLLAAELAQRSDAAKLVAALQRRPRRHGVRSAARRVSTAHRSREARGGLDLLAIRLRHAQTR